MRNRRYEPRLMCADLIEVRWRDPSGRPETCVANLEDISASGVCLQMEVDIPLNTMITISGPKGDYVGQVRYCVYREIGFFIGIQVEPGSKGSRRNFKPMHLFDPQRLGPANRPER